MAARLPSLAVTLAVLSLPLIARGAAQAQTAPPGPELAVAVWDWHFPNKSDLFNDPNNGRAGSSLKLEPGYPISPDIGQWTHGHDVAYVVAQGQPYVVIHPITPIFTYEDPELCLLVEEPAFLGRLPSCRPMAEKAMAQVSDFIRQNGIRIVVMAWGFSPEDYFRNNPRLLKTRFQDVDPGKIDETLQRNMEAESQMIENLFRAHPNTLFIAAAGSRMRLNLDETKVPFASLSPGNSNLLAVTAFADGGLADNVSWGPNTIDVAADITGLRVPTPFPFGASKRFTGTSAAAAVAGREIAKAWQAALGAGRLLGPAAVKSAVRDAPQHPGLEGKVIRGALLDGEALTRRLIQ